jgi:hypothetical protein
VNILSKRLRAAACSGLHIKPIFSHAHSSPNQLGMCQNLVRSLNMPNSNEWMYKCNTRHIRPPTSLVCTKIWSGHWICLLKRSLPWSYTHAGGGATCEGTCDNSPATCVARRRGFSSLSSRFSDESHTTKIIASFVSSRKGALYLVTLVSSFVYCVLVRVKDNFKNHRIILKNYISYKICTKNVTYLSIYLHMSFFNIF